MKEKLATCQTIADSERLFRGTSPSIIQEFINALENAKEYIDLTMRDNYLLIQAKSIMTYHYNIPQ